MIDWRPPHNNWWPRVINWMPPVIKWRPPHNNWLHTETGGHTLLYGGLQLITVCHQSVNASQPSDAYRRQQTKLSLVRVIALHLFSAMSLSEPKLLHFSSGSWINFHWNFNKNAAIFIQEIEIRNIVYKLAAILFWYKYAITNSYVSDLYRHWSRQWFRKWNTTFENPFWYEQEVIKPLVLWVRDIKEINMEFSL